MACGMGALRCLRQAASVSARSVTRDAMVTEESACASIQAALALSALPEQDRVQPDPDNDAASLPFLIALSSWLHRRRTKIRHTGRNHNNYWM